MIIAEFARNLQFNNLNRHSFAVILAILLSKDKLKSYINVYSIGTS